MPFRAKRSLRALRKRAGSIPKLSARSWIDFSASFGEAEPCATSGELSAASFISRVWETQSFAEHRRFGCLSVDHRSEIPLRPRVPLSGDRLDSALAHFRESRPVLHLPVLARGSAPSSTRPGPPHQILRRAIISRVTVSYAAVPTIAPSSHGWHTHLQVS